MDVPRFCLYSDFNIFMFIFFFAGNPIFYLGFAQEIGGTTNLDMNDFIES